MSVWVEPRLFRSAAAAAAMADEDVTWIIDWAYVTTGVSMRVLAVIRLA